MLKNTMIEDYMMDNDLDHVVVVTMHKCGHESLYCGTYDDGILESTLDKYVKYEIAKDYQITKKIKSDTLLVYEAVESKCSSCWLITDIQRIYCDECERPTGFDNITLYHGLAAFTGEYTMSHALENLKTIIEHPEYQICCSTKTNGNIGIITKGEVLVASNMDLWTYIDPDTCRRYYEYDPCAHVHSKYRRADYIISDASQLDSTVWEHDEMVTANNKITAIWIKQGAFTNDDLKQLIDIAKEYNIEIIKL